MNHLFEVLGTIAGIGGLSIGILIVIFKEILRLKIFPKLKKEKAYKLLQLIIIFSFTVALTGIIAYLALNLKESKAQESNNLLLTTKEIVLEKSVKLNKYGGVTAVGIGSSQNFNIARQIAITDAQINYASNLNSNVNSISKSEKKNFNNRDSTNFNDYFESLSSIVVKETIEGISVFFEKTIQQEKNYTCFVVMGLSPKAIEDNTISKLEKEGGKALLKEYLASKKKAEFNKMIKEFNNILNE